MISVRSGEVCFLILFLSGMMQLPLNGYTITD